MRIHYTPRLARGPGGVAHPRWLVLVEIRIVEVAGRGLEQVFIAFITRRGDVSFRGRHDEDPLEAYAFLELLEQWHQHVVHEQEAITGMTHDIGEVIGM